MKLSRLAKTLLLAGYISTRLVQNAYSPDKEITDIMPIELKEQKTIVLDPGHGGYDYGYTLNNIKEKNINLNIAKYLKPMLEKQGYKVFMTREHDTDINQTNIDYNYDGKINLTDELHSRKKLIKKTNADYFLSIHNNADRSKFTHGLELWVYGYRYPHEKDNNKIDHHEPQKAKYKNKIAYKFANDIEKTFQNAGFKTRVACGDFNILEKNPIQKSIIIEYGYLTNPNDLRRMQSEDFQKYCAEITAKYFKEKETPHKD